MFCYLVGSVSGSMVIGKIYNFDVLSSGSRSAGATNTFRVSGPIPAFLVLLIDVLKGYIACTIASIYINFFQFSYKGDTELYIVIMCGIAAVIGHIFPIYFNFKGGKGIGTIVGMLIYVFPIGLLISFIVWLIILILTGYVSLASIIGCCSLPINVLVLLNSNNYDIILFYLMIAISVFIIITHRENIIRLIEGRENRFEKIMLFRKKT